MDEFLNRVIKGLECCTVPFTKCYDGGCPYANYQSGCKVHLKEDAILLLQLQKPRVMAYEKMLESEICFLEVRGIKEIYPFIRFEVDGQPYWCSPYVGSAGSSFEQLATQDEYMKKSRCWTDRPTDERRAEIPWEGDEEECSKN